MNLLTFQNFLRIFLQFQIFAIEMILICFQMIYTFQGRQVELRTPRRRASVSEATVVAALEQLLALVSALRERRIRLRQGGSSFDPKLGLPHRLQARKENRLKISFRKLLIRVKEKRAGVKLAAKKVWGSERENPLQVRLFRERVNHSFLSRPDLRLNSNNPPPFRKGIRILRALLRACSFNVRSVCNISWRVQAVGQLLINRYQ